MGNRPAARSNRGIAPSLVALVVAAALPLLVFALVMATVIVDQRKAAVTDSLQATARALQVAVDRLLEGQLAAISVLAADTAMEGNDPGAFAERARRVMAVHPNWHDVSMIDVTSHVIVASALPIPRPAPSTIAPAAVDAAARSGKPVIAGAFSTGALLRQPILLFVAPVLRAGKVRYVLAAVMSPQPVNDLFAEQGMSATWTGAVLDGQLKVGGRSRQFERFVGSPTTPLVAEKVRSSQGGMFISQTRDGQSVYTVFSRSPSTSWSVVLGVPPVEVDGPIHDALLRLAAGGGMLLAMALSLAAWVGRGIVRRRDAFEHALKDEIDAQRRIESDLRLSQQRLNDYSRSSADWFWETDAALRFSYLSENFTESTGLPPEQVLGQTCREMLQRDARNLAAAIAGHLAELDSHRPFRDFEYCAPNPCAPEQWLSVSGVPYFDDAGSFAGYRGIGQSITLRRRAEELAENRNKLLREAVDRISSGFVIYDDQDRLVMCNERYREMYGASRDLMVPGASFADIVRIGAERGQYKDAMGDVDGWVASRIAAHQDARGQPFEQQLEDGRWLLLIEDRTSGGYIVGNRIDVTELKRTQEQVRKLSMAIEQCPSSILIADLDSRIEYVNEAFLKTTGYSRDEIIGYTPQLLYSGKTPKSTYEALRRNLNQGLPWRGEFHNRRKDGSEYYDLAIISPVRQPDGRITHFVAIQENITQRKLLDAELESHRHRLEELVANRTAQLAEARDAAEAANRAKSAFLANMSHEIRTPLNAITGMAYLIRRGQISPTQKDQLAKIEVASRHLAEIINDVLDLSKIEAGRLMLDEDVVDVRGVLAGVQSIADEKARAKGLALFIECPTELPNLIGDQTRLRQALLNYVGNAVKFTQRGTVTIRAAIVHTSGADVLLRLEVRDTGVGIYPHDIPRLFTAFEQADNSTTRQYGGTGLGLSITKRLAEMMGGQVGVDSQPGIGSTFWMTARLKVGSTPTGQETLRPVERPVETLQREYGGRRILVAEDEPINREIAVSLLEAAGLDCDVAEDGEEAVDMAATGGYDLILMDMQMPRLDGLAAARRIRVLFGDGRPPIVAMTANAFVEDKLRCSAAGMNDFISKPTEAEVLYSKVLKWLANEREGPPSAFGVMS